jgi:hypothetical protein
MFNQISVPPLGSQHTTQAAGGFKKRDLNRRIKLQKPMCSREPCDTAADDGDAGGR